MKKNICLTARLSQKVYERDSIAMFLQIQSDDEIRYPLLLQIA